MRPPGAHGAALPAGWPRRRGAGGASSRWPSLGRRGRRADSAALAAIVLAGALAVAGYLAAITPGHRPAAPPAVASAGTALLGTATCTDWQDASVARRLTIIQTLGIAATRPDPENAGATLREGQAYGLFERVCSTRASRSALLYEAYNRAASFQWAGAGWGPISAPR